MPRGAQVTHLSDADLTAAGSPVLGRIARLLRPYRGRLVLVGLAVVVAAALTSVLPFLTKAVFDDALFPPDREPRLDLLAWLVGFMCLIPVITALISVGQNWLTSTIGNSAMADLRSELFEHLQKMELAFFTATKTGAIQSRLANDVAGVRTVLTDTATSILQNSVTVAAAFVSMLLLSWQLTILTLVLMPVFIAVQLRVGRRRQRLARRTQESLSEMTAITEEALSVSGILLSKVFGRAESETERYRDANREQVRLQVDQAMTGRTFFATVQTFFAITPALIYLAAGLMISGGTTSLSAGTIVAFTTLQARLQMPLLQLMRVTLDVQTSLALFRRIFEYLDLEPAIVEKPGAQVLPSERVEGRVELRDVWFRYPEPRELSGGRSGDRFAEDGAVMPTPAPQDEPGWALQQVSMMIEPGQLAAIVGPSGSGKTTTTYLVPRFYDVTRGAVLVDGHDVRDLTLDSVTGAVGMVTQEPYLFHGSIRDNLAYAKPGATAEEIEQAARDANIHERIMSFPTGYETITGERGFRLSGGEKQRIAIARVLLADPRILILDEATSALDSETERLVQEALERATHSRTTIAIAHRLSTIRSADVIFGLQDGRLVEHGTHDELLAAGGLYARLYVEQFGSGQIEQRFTDGVRLVDGSTVRNRDDRRADVPL
ncbi:multidrug ABC transporter ATP-binding protein [Aeromicrobium sp. Root495]|uniref:ABC transporter ATP-binding protein n=1 Tax=Aeromicrobium sp. Root495 TaxID=1736550 RepID=UPI0006FAF7B5|nr:ABC transporter ATP-binding protein [Aeromicrobium sp. Root495]KQY55961.1 multidrug ABC transporter ATP-binding protein [Aeromicrobium sp. Root495]